MRHRLMLLSGVAALVAGMNVAGAIEPHHEYRRLVESAQNLTALKSDLFGESVGLYSGKTDFSATDIDLPGNNALPVRLRRTFNVELRISAAGSGYDDALGGIGGWSIEVPHITGMFGSADAWAPARCSVEMVPTYNTSFRLTDIWQGNFIHTPGTGGRVMLRAEASTPMPNDGTGRKWSTAQRDAIDCIPMKSGLPGEGYRVKTTTGDIYHFDTAVQRYAGFITKGRGAAQQRARSNRVRIYVLASRVEDRFGNVVNYEYNSNGHPTRIWSSDGRQIDMTYNGEHLRAATANGRTWRYDYHQVEDETRLSGVHLPDASRWQMGYSSVMKQSTPPWDGGSTKDCAEQPPAPNADFVLTLDHPSGAHGRFSFSNSRHYRSGVHMSECIQRISGGALHYELAVPNFFDVMSLDSKTLSGPGLPEPLTWTYAYRGGIQRLWGSSGSPALYPCTTCPEEKSVELTNPDGTSMEYRYGFQFARNEGRLLETRVKDAGGTTVKSERSVYMTDAEVVGQPFAPRYGIINNGDDPSTAQVRPIVRSILDQDGVQYVSGNARHCGGTYCYDFLAYPTKVFASNSTNYESGDSIQYYHDTAGWVLGLVASRASMYVGTAIERTLYDARSLPSEEWAHGLMKWRRNYHSDGTIASVADANGNVTTMDGWKRGVPQTIRFADGRGLSATVDDNGWIKAVRDQLGALTSYEHDASGRVTRVNHPSGDLTAWNPVVQSFDQVMHEQHGLAPGHWMVSASEGTSRSLSYLDALWRPVLTHEFDAANPAETQRFKRFSYDVNGSIEFQSYPGRTPSLSQGIWTQYDALGREVLSATDSEHGLLTTLQQYLPGAKRRTTDPEGAQTLTTFWVEDTPSYEIPKSIDHPEGSRTEFARNFFGKPLSITRRNQDRTQSLTRNYVYDAHDRLCKSIEPEAGATLISYDPAGNIVSTASGVVAGHRQQCNPELGSERRIVREYDTMNRLATLRFPDGRGDQEWVYANDGKVGSIHTASEGRRVSNHYAYNNRRLLVGEQLVHANGEMWDLQYSYDGNGSLSALRYPSGETVHYAPNGLGQPSAAGSFAKGVTYHPDGRMASFAYGNGVRSSVEINARGLPLRLAERGSTEDILNDALSYDGVGNLLAINDETPGGAGSRHMRYDALARLTHASSRSFGGDGDISYTYDALDNLTSVLQPGQQMHHYVYDASNRLTNVRNEAGSTVVGIAYDVQGNLSRRNGEQFQFDFGNRLRQVDSKESYLYDGHGRRTESASSALGAIRSMYASDGKLVHQKNERVAKTYDYVHLNGRLVASLAATGVAAAPVLKVPGHTTDDAYPVGWTSMTGALRYELQELPAAGDWQPAYSGVETSLQLQGKEAGHYTYRVRSCNAAGCGAWSGTAAIFVRRAPTPPFAITVPGLGPAGNYVIAWLPPRPRVPSETQYELEELGATGDWSQVFRGEPLEWRAAGRPTGRYTYRVRACNPDGCSDYTVGAQIEVYHPPVAAGLSGPAETLNGSFSLYWSAREEATSYQVDESINGGQWIRVMETTALMSTFTGRKTATYAYRVSACNRELCSAPSATHSVNSIIPPEYAPGATSISQQPYASHLVLNWSAVDTSTHYQVWEELNGGGFHAIADANSLQFARSGLGSGNWSYKIRGCNRAGCGPTGAVVSAHVLNAPVAPVITEAHQTMRDRPPTDLTCRVVWTGQASADRYELYSGQRGTAGGLLYSGPATSVFSRNTGQYCSEWQTVRACNAAGCSPVSQPRQRYLEIIPGGILP